MQRVISSFFVEVIAGNSISTGIRGRVAAISCALYIKEEAKMTCDLFMSELFPGPGTGDLFSPVYVNLSDFLLLQRSDPRRLISAVPIRGKKKKRTM
jgi:hypothetical protein